MFDILKFIFTGSSEEVEKAIFASDDIRLAEAALLFHVIQSDGKIVDSERVKMKEVLQEDFDLSNEEIENLCEAAKLAENEAIDLFRFTSLLKVKLDRERRVQIVENLWEMVFADGFLHELEDNVVWRIAELLGVDSAERIQLKFRVKNRHNI